jgi:hypothetical protein
MKLFLVFLSIFNAFVIFAQITPGPKILAHGQSNRMKKDTTIESDTSKENKEPRYFYLTINTNAYVNTIGTFSERFSPSIEFGRTYGIFDLGLAIGKLNLSSLKHDSTIFLEFRPTINVFSKGRFAEALCLGGGAVFGASEGFMTEICNSINFNIHENWALAILQGYEFFDGKTSKRETQYMGLNVTYNFLRPHSVNKRRKRMTILGDN